MMITFCYLAGKESYTLNFCYRNLLSLTSGPYPNQNYRRERDTTFDKLRRVAVFNTIFSSF